MTVKNDEWYPSSVSEFTLNQVEQAIAVSESALRKARAGEFDKMWKDLPLIDGRSQKEVFMESLKPNLEALYQRRKELTGGS